MLKDPPKGNLFANATKVQTSKQAKNKIPSLPVTRELAKHLTQFAQAKLASKKLEAQISMSEAYIKAQATDLYLEQCKKEKRNIGSFKLGEVTISVQDRYAKIEGEIADMIAKQFPDAVDKETQYLFNQEILTKNIEAINDALQSADIPQEDLYQLIKAKEVTTVKKGTIDTLANYGEQMRDLYLAICPTMSMSIRQIS